MKVKATRTGFYRGRRIRAGSVFEIGEQEKPGSWMKPLGPETPKPDARKPEAKEPKTKA